MRYIDDRNFLVEMIARKFKSEKKRAEYIDYINSLVEKDLPPILSFRHLADTLSLSTRNLYEIAFNTGNFYSTFQIPKRNGGLREISKPYESVAVIQQWICTNILKSSAIVFTAAVTGYVEHKSIIDHVKPHVQSACLVKFDIKDFFPSISVTHVTNIFMGLGYNEQVARTLAALVTLQGSLPQGACTSPTISNLRLTNFDAEMGAFCHGKQLLYSRYVDDIVISGDRHLLENLNKLREHFERHGLIINETKTCVYGLETEVRFVTGLIIQRGRVRLTKAMRRKIRVQAHLFLRDFPRLLDGAILMPALQMPSFSDPNRKDVIYEPIFIERILGKLNYWINVEPDDPYPRVMKDKIYGMLAAI